MVKRIQPIGVWLVIPLFFTACGVEFRAPFSDGQFRWPLVRKSGEAEALPAELTALPMERPERTTPIIIPSTVQRSVLADAQSSLASTLSADLQIPDSAELDRYPEDFAIGSLRVDGPTDAYAFAKGVLADIIGNRSIEDRFVAGGKEQTDRIRAVLGQLDGRLVGRLGSSATIPGGGLAFLVRFVGRTSSVSGDLYLVPGTSGWRIDELVLDKPAADFSPEGEARFDPLRFSRFF